MLKLKELRKLSGETQSSIAKKINVSRQVYANYENEINEPPLDVLCKLATVFDCSVDYLLGRTDDFGNNSNNNLIERPAYDITDKKLVDFMKLYKIMTDLQKAQTLGYVIGLLENAGVNVKKVLGY